MLGLQVYPGFLGMHIEITFTFAAHRNQSRNIEVAAQAGCGHLAITIITVDQVSFDIAAEFETVFLGFLLFGGVVFSHHHGDFFFGCGFGTFFHRNCLGNFNRCYCFLVFQQLHHQRFEFCHPGFELFDAVPGGEDIARTAA